MPNDGVVAQAPNFPTDLVYNARFQNSPKTVAGQALGSLGNSIPDLIQQMIQAQKQKKFQDMISGLSKNPALTPEQQALVPFLDQSNIGQLGPALFKQPKSSKKTTTLANGNIGVVDPETNEVFDTGTKAYIKPPTPAKPPSPVPAANLDVKVQEANRPSWTDALFPWLKKPPIVNPLKQTNDDPLGLNQ